jgi:tRNA (adenine37-N6)-methyltransferase
MTNLELHPIGRVSSVYRQKFGIPRQPGLAPSAKAVLRLDPTPELREAVRGLETFSHVWVIFLFHSIRASDRRGGTVRPPRLGGAKRIGVLATRSPHRPNPIGLSAVQLERVLPDAKDGPELHIAGVDLLDGTPVLDVKPYLAYSDAIPAARGGWTSHEEMPKLRVEISNELRSNVDEPLLSLIAETLATDPRPAHQAQAADPGPYAIRLGDYDVKFRFDADRVLVTEITDERS